MPYEGVKDVEVATRVMSGEVSLCMCVKLEIFLMVQQISSWTRNALNFNKEKTY